MSDLDAGYYWVRHMHQHSDWEPAEWDGERWSLVGSRESWGSDDMYEIGERVSPIEAKRDA